MYDMKKTNEMKIEKRSDKRYETDKRNTKPIQTKRNVSTNDTKPTNETTKFQKIRNLHKRNESLLMNTYKRYEI